MATKDTVYYVEARTINHMTGKVINAVYELPRVTANVASKLRKEIVELQKQLQTKHKGEDILGNTKYREEYKTLLSPLHSRYNKLLPNTPAGYIITKGEKYDLGSVVEKNQVKNFEPFQKRMAMKR